MRSWLVVSSLAIFGLSAQAALAYVLPADSMLRLLSERRRELKITDVSLQLTAELASEDAPVDERLFLKYPERLRLVRQQDETPTVYVEREGQRAAGPESGLKRQSGPPLDIIATLLFPAGNDTEETTARMRAALKAANVNTSVTSLGRQGELVAYIIGARSWEPEKPQLWLSKSSFLPVRFVVIGGDGARYETRWLEWASSTTNEVFPQIVEEYKDGKLVRRAEVQKLQTNQNLPETLFEVPKA